MRIKQINNLTIQHKRTFSAVSDANGFSYLVYSPDGRALEDFSTPQAAEIWCRSTTDFVRRK